MESFKNSESGGNVQKEELSIYTRAELMDKMYFFRAILYILYHQLIRISDTRAVNLLTGKNIGDK